MENVTWWLLCDITRRTRTRIRARRASLGGDDICDIPREIFDALKTKLDFEQRNSRDLSVVRAEEKRVNRCVQTTLETYSKILKIESHAVKCEEHGRANDALLRLQRTHAYFRSANRRVLHAAFLEDWEASAHLDELHHILDYATCV